MDCQKSGPLIQDQIGLKQDLLSLQQAINAYVKKSDT